MTHAIVGRWWHWRMKGDQWMAVLRAWIMPVMTGAGVTKYLGVPTSLAIAAWLGLALASEIAAVLIGWWAHRSGVTEADYQLAVDRDPFRRESLEIGRATNERLDRVLAALSRKGGCGPQSSTTAPEAMKDPWGGVPSPRDLRPLLKWEDE